MVAITDNTKSKSKRISLKGEPINGGIKRWQTLMSSIFMKSTYSSKKSMFLRREAHKSSFDVNQESCVWRCADLTSGMWWELQRDYPPLTQRRKKLQLSKRDLVSWFIKNSKHAWFAGYNLACLSISHTGEFTCTCVKTNMWSGSLENMAVVASVRPLSVQQPK